MKKWILFSTLLICCLNAEEPKMEIARLEQQIEEDPDNAEIVTLLASAYYDKQELQKALELFERRIAMGGSEEEIFQALYMIGRIQEALDLSPEKISNSYCKAFAYCPHRPEPIFRLAKHLNAKQNFPLSYALLKLAMSIEIPEDHAAGEQWIYTYGILYEFAQSAFNLGKMEEAMQAYRKILKGDLPEVLREEIEQNLSLTELNVIPKDEE